MSERIGYELAFIEFLGGPGSASVSREYLLRGGEILERHDNIFRLYVPKRTEWDGTGLPPVGTACEALWSTVSGAATYATVKVLAHDEDRAVYRFLTLDRKGEYGSDTLHSTQGFAAFRPIRTAEQIAADERAAAIDEMVKRFALHDLDLVPWRDLFAQMYDAGCLRP